MRQARYACALVLAAACAREAPPDFHVRDLAVRLETDAPFARHPGFPARLEFVLDAALHYWGGDFGDLAGRTLTFTSSAYVECAGASDARGCFDGDLRVTTWDPGIGTVACVEQTVLVHEIGHAVIGDRLHLDARWLDLAAVQEALSGRTGYVEGGEVPCEVLASVWRSPPG